jgi:hypothetical protein
MTNGASEMSSKALECLRAPQNSIYWIRNQIGCLRNENERVKMKNSVSEFNSDASELILDPIDWNLKRRDPIWWNQTQFESNRLESDASSSNLLEPKSNRTRYSPIYWIQSLFEGIRFDSGAPKA